MTDLSISTARQGNWVTPFFAGTMLASAALVFLVEPMIARMILPQLGGSPAVWNTSVAFFQVALLTGYLYAHLLQRLPSIKAQIGIHLVLLAAATCVMPIGVTSAFGPAPIGNPVVWLLAVLTVSIGAPFVMLSATAPLLQAWYARAMCGDAENPYTLYASSNLGSMFALIAYPLIVEPLVTLHAQSLDWTLGFRAFCALMLGASFLVLRGSEPAPIRHAEAADRPGWREWIEWIALAAIPSSLMLGATTYISNDVASVPFLWVVPLALYLLTFIISFQANPAISPERARLWQTVFIIMAAALLCVNASSLLAHIVVYTGAFFFSALVCHQRLAAGKPAIRHLTEFYLLVSLGGVIGGIFNAFLAPALFSSVAEFPLVLALATLARPWRTKRFSVQYTVAALVGIAAVALIAFVPDVPSLRYVPIILAIAAASAAAVVSGRKIFFALVIGAFCVEAAIFPIDNHAALFEARTFFGVHRVTEGFEPALGGELHLLYHGTTVHGAQPQAASERCRATTYYAKSTPIGQVFSGAMAQRAALRIGVVGLGAGTVATYTRPGDRMTFFEIDPEVERIARNRRYFTYLSDCAKGDVDVVLGDARLTLARQPAGNFDLLQLDAFSADTVPTHLLTVEAFRLYLRALKPDGIILVHVTNRNLALEAPVAATVKEAGAVALMQAFAPPADASTIAASPSQVMLVAKTRAALKRFTSDPRWRQAQDRGVRAWNDDYSNVVGALIDHARGL